MRLFGQDCGCDSRREIMFTYGQLGVPEATLLVVAVVAVVVGWKIGKRVPA